MELNSYGRKPKKIKAICFAYEDGHEALEWLETEGRNFRGGMSNYIVRLLLEDKLKRTGKVKSLR